MRSKGGRPKKTSDTNATGNTVRKTQVIHPNTQRNYLVNSQGEVFRVLWDGREQRLKPWWSGPYLKVYIYGCPGVRNKQGRKAVYVHKLVYDHFGKKSNKKFIHHINSKETDNSIQNLQKVTLEENMKAKKFFYRDDAGTVKRKIKKKST